MPMRFGLPSLLLTSLLACSGTSSGNPADPGGGGGFDVPHGAKLVRSPLAREQAPSLSASDADTLGAGNRAFAFALHQELAATTEANVFFSPFSVSTALAMTYAGAEGETEREMAEAMRFELSEPALHRAFNATDQALATRKDALAEDSEGQGFELSIVNQAWGLPGYEFEQPYLDVLAQNYGAGMLLVDFGDSEPTRTLINDWVEEQTEQRVKDLLPPGSITVDTRLVLTNAIYFKANWLNQFDPKLTVDATFTAAAGERTVAMMHQSFVGAYGEGAGYRAVELPYLSPDVRMLFILPEGDVDGLIAAMDGPSFDTMLAGLSEYSVTLDLPRFSFEAERPLSGSLKALGMQLAFGDADFSGINGGREALWIDEVYHKAFVAVDEQGTEAAAATAVVIVGESEKPSTEISFDRPFVFVIYDQPTGQILFLGTLRDPG